MTDPDVPPNQPDTPSAGHADPPDHRGSDLQRALGAERAELSARLSALRGQFDDIVSAARGVATDDEHDPEGATIAYERAQVTALVEQASRRLIEVEAALRRLSDGGYGRCERCGRPIGEDRLPARPSTRTCIDCARRVTAGRA